jgi:hypothetical protein
MAYQSPRLELVKDNLIRIYHPDLIEPKSFLTASITAGGTTLTVENNAGFSNTDPQTLVLFEGLGLENAEIKRVNGAITAGTSLTVQGVTFNHAINTSIQAILFNQVEISGAATATGAKTVIATVDLNLGGLSTDYVVTSTTYNYYFARFYNSLATTPYHGAYSDALIFSGFPTNSVGFIRRNAFKNLGENFGEKWNANWVYDQIYACELDLTKAKQRWGQAVVYDYDLGDLSTGLARLALPTDIEDSKTNKAILGLRIGTNKNLTYLERPDFEEVMYSVAHSTMNSTAAEGATSFVLDDSNDFEDSDSVTIGEDSFTYTTNTRSTKTLSGITAITSEIAAGTDVWQNITLGEPLRYTVNDGYIYFDIPPSEDYDGRNVWIDYIKAPSRPDSDADTVLFNDPYLYVYWLEMAIKKEKNNGELSPNDISLIEYNRRKILLVGFDKDPYGLRLIPNVPRRSR